MRRTSRLASSFRRTIVGGGAAFCIAIAIAVSVGVGRQAPVARSAASTREQSRREALATMRAGFAVLRAERQARLPLALRRALTTAPATYDLDPSAAREATATGIWLIPGNGWLCIAADDAEGLGLVCVRQAAAEAGALSLVESSETTGAEEITGAVPDGRPTVSALNAASEPLASVAVHENTYRLSVRGAARMKIG